MIPKAQSIDCIYCYNLKSNLEGKKYCKKCKDKCYKECTKCHLPLQSEDSYFFDFAVCNKCFIKKKDQESRKKKLPVKQPHLHYT